MTIESVKTLLTSRRTRRTILYAFVAVLLFGVLGFLALPPIVKYVATGKMSEALHRPVTIQRIRINPYALSITVEGLEVKEPDGVATFAGFDSLYVDVQAASLLRRAPVINEIRLVNPRFRAVRFDVNHFNFSDLVEEFSAKPKEDNEAPIPAFSLNNVQISGGTIEFDDRFLNGTHRIDGITLTLPFVSSLPDAADIAVEPHLGATIDGASMALNGKIKPFAVAREGEFVLAVGGLQLRNYVDYLPVRWPITLESGTLDTELTLTFRQEADREPGGVLSGTATVGNLRVLESGGAPLISFGRFDVTVDAADLAGGRLAIKKVALEKPDIVARVNPRGGLNWLDLLPESPAAARGPEAKKVSSHPVDWSIGEVRIDQGVVHWVDDSRPRPFHADVKGIDVVIKKLAGRGGEADFEASAAVDGGELLKADAVTLKEGALDLARHRIRIGEVRVKGGHGAIKRSRAGRIEWIEPPVLRTTAASHDEPTAPWRIDVARCVGDDIDVRFEDAAVSPKAIHSVAGLGFVVSNLSSEPAKTARIKAGFRFNRKGSVAIEGRLTPMPLDASLDLDLKGIEVLPLQPYFSQKLNIAITRGQVTAKGNARLKQVTGVRGKADAGWGGGFSGQVTVSDFQAVDKLNSADFLRWKSLYLGKIDARLNPESVSVGEIALADFFARVIVSREGKLNLLQIVRQEEKKPGKTDGTRPAPAVASSQGKSTATLAAGRGPTIPLKIGKITVQGGSIRFTDNFIKPNYSANLRGIGGSLVGLSSAPGTRARLELRGSYDDVAPLNIVAHLNPLSAKPYLDLEADVKGVELTSLSAYSGKYAGYAIEKGKLSLFVKYKVENDKLEAENRIFLDQLTFGEPVESPYATSLPVKLAVALLKNRAGEIDINVPISGSLDDPQFSVGGVIFKVIVNLVTKAITSPFALIGSMFGGGEELSTVEFDAGRATLSPEAVKRLETLAKALIDRPELKLEVEGKFDPERDPEGLRQARIDFKVRAVKREELTRKNVETGAAETVEVSADEYPALLERVYRAEKFPKPRNIIGMVKKLPVEEMEKLMLAHSTVEEADLYELGDRRARVVRDWLVSHDVPADRIFLLPSRPATVEEKNGGEKKIAASRVDFSLK